MLPSPSELPAWFVGAVPGIGNMAIYVHRFEDDVVIGEMLTILQYGEHEGKLAVAITAWPPELAGHVAGEIRSPLSAFMGLSKATDNFAASLNEKWGKPGIRIARVMPMIPGRNGGRPR